MNEKTRIIARLIKIAADYIEPDRYHYPYHVADLQDPEYIENDYPIEASHFPAYIPGDYGEDKPYIRFPVATKESDSGSAMFRQAYESDLDALKKMLKHERTHGDTIGINPVPEQIAASRTTDDYYDPVKEQRFLYEYPAIVQEQLYDAPTGWVTPMTTSNSIARRTKQQQRKPGSEPYAVDAYYDSIFPESRGMPTTDGYGWKRKAYHTPLPYYVNNAGKVIESPYDTFSLSLFNAPKKITDMPIGYQNAVKNFQNTRKAKQQFDANPAQYRSQQQRIQNGLLPLATRIPYDKDNSGDYELPEDNTNSRIQPIPIGLPSMQTKHFITPWFNRPTDTRTTQQMDEMEKDISHSYKLDNHLRQNFKPNGANSAGA